MCWIGLAAGSVSCSVPDDLAAPAVQVEFDVALQAPTRAPEALNPTVYSAKVYLFREETPGGDRYVYSGEQALTGGSLSLGGLTAGTAYRFVFLAVPKRQQPALPDCTSTRPAYSDATATYLSGVQTSNEIFRSILSFKASAGSSSYSVVLTRQNGALQIRLDNTYGEIKTVKLEVAGLPKIYFNDGTGGRVIATGSEIQLSKSDRPSKTSDYRISINLLPVEDLTGKGRLTLTYSWGLQRVYSLRSTSGRIPIYPNQITWLVLDEACSGNADENGSGGDLSVSAAAGRVAFGRVGFAAAGSRPE